MYRLCHDCNFIKQMIHQDQPSFTKWYPFFPKKKENSFVSLLLNWNSSCYNFESFLYILFFLNFSIKVVIIECNLRNQQGLLCKKGVHNTIPNSPVRLNTTTLASHPDLIESEQHSRRRRRWAATMAGTATEAATSGRRYGAWRAGPTAGPCTGAATPPSPCSASSSSASPSPWSPPSSRYVSPAAQNPPVTSRSLGLSLSAYLVELIRNR